ncbi:MAG: hypothetical protein OXM55_03245 [Bdellovibrionales bacterium]|nr:hypothetical protein [Bdellovibrionales bacterium]
MRRKYNIDPIIINGKVIKKLIIDPHVDKHADHINDDLIKKMVRQLDEGIFLSEKELDGFSYFATILKVEGLYYKLVWLLEKDCLYIGVITAYRDRRGK